MQFMLLEGKQSAKPVNFIFTALLEIAAEEISFSFYIMNQRHRYSEKHTVTFAIAHHREIYKHAQTQI